MAAALTVCLGDWTVRPSINYVTWLSSNIRDTDAYGTASDNFFAGIGVSMAF
jgi:hypothetical protein